MAASNHERVGKALTLLRDGIKPELEKAFTAMFGEDWVPGLNAHLHQPDRNPDPDDLAFLLKGMEVTWNDFFREVFGRAERAYVALLRDARNDWAHNKRFSSDETNRILDFCEIVLNTFQAKEQVEEVQALRRSLQRQVFDEEARTEGRKAAREATKGEPQAGLAPWREVVAPHHDVAQGRFEQAEFAADLFQVLTGRADPEYQDPESFFARTFITDGLRDLLRIAAKRLSGRGGDPIVELQTSFGGGKTHSLIALYHLASGIPIERLAGVTEALASEGLSIPDDVKRAVFVGQMMSPSTVHEKPDGTQVRTVWGELAWQLGGAEGYAMVAEDDINATSPGDNLIKLFERFGPALILIDEWVAYARLLPDRAEDARLPAGDFDGQFTFAQTLTEAASAVGNTLVLVSIPSSELEVGGEKGKRALEKLKHVVSRKAAHWQPTTTDESFEIVRRRLFEPVPADSAPKRDAVVRAFHHLYLDNSADFPTEAKEAEYRRRMEAAYPLHPELFDRLYQDWSTLDRFQRTRGMLKMMATVIAELWQRGDSSLLIMPGTIPIDSPTVIPQLTRYLDDQWEPIIRTDVDGPNSIPLRIDQQRPNLGRYSAARRVARTTYLGTAPRHGDRRGVDLKRIILGCAQPGEKPGVFQDALRHVAAETTYLYNEGAQYWYDTKPTLARLAADRAESNWTDDDADARLRERIARVAGKGPFGAVHVFPEGPGDVADEDDQVRLVILPLAAPNGTGENSAAAKAAQTILEQRQGGPRLNRNLLVFLAADNNRVPELRAAMKSRLAWQSILDERGVEGLNLDASQIAQAERKLADADDVIEHRIGETYQSVLIPRQEPKQPNVTWQTMRAGGDEPLADKVGKKLASSEDLISSYSGVRVRMDLDRAEAPLWDGDHVGVARLWSYYAQYLYMPRLTGFGVLAAAISDGVSRTTWEQETFAYAERYDPDADRYSGLVVGRHVDVGRSRDAVLVQSERAAVQLGEDSTDTGDEPPPNVEQQWAEDRPATTADGTKVKRRFYGRVDLDSVRAIRDLESIIENIVAHLEGADGGEVTLTLEIQASADAFDDRIQRTVNENAAQLGFTEPEFEE